MKPLTVLFLLLGLGSLMANEPLLIQKTGEYVLSEKEKISLEEKDGLLKLTRLSTQRGLTLKIVPGWKLYSNVENVLWIFDGEFELIRTEFTDKGIAFEESSQSRQLWNEVPKAFAAMLPKTRLKPLPEPSGSPSSPPGTIRPAF